MISGASLAQLPYGVRRRPTWFPLWMSSTSTNDLVVHGFLALSLLPQFEKTVASRKIGVPFLLKLKESYNVTYINILFNIFFCFLDLERTVVT